MKNHLEILIIDDTVDLTLSLKDILEEYGFGVAIASDRKTAVAICRERVFDLALIDIKLPDADGLALVEELSAMLPEMEFIIITGYGTIEIAAEAVRKKNIVSFEMKPLDMTRFLVLIHQIGEKRHAAAALRLSEQRFQIFAESATDAIISIDEEGGIFYVNPEFENIFGYKVQEIIGQPITTLINLRENQIHSGPQSNLITEAILHQGKRLEVQGRHKSGKAIPLEISFGGFSTKEGKFYSAIIRDITERKVAESSLQRKLLIEKIVSTISTRLVGTDDFDQTIYDSLREILNYSKGRSVFLLIRNPVSETGRQIYSWSSQGKLDFFFREEERPHSVYDWFIRELQSNHELLIPDTGNMPDDLAMEKAALQRLGIRSLLILPIMGNGEVVGCFGLDNIEDPGLWTLEEFNLLITLSNLFSSAFHRKSIEQDLIESEELHHILLDATREGIIIINLQGRITEVSNIALEIFNLSKKEDLTGKRFLEYIPAELRKNKNSYYNDKIRKGIPNTFELTFLRNDGSRFFGEVTISLFRQREDKNRGYLVVIRDISERKKIDKQMIHTERMAGIGVMAAGMAHEINQPLNTISLAMDNLILSMNTGSPDKTYLDNKTTKIFDNITRIRNIIDHVRAFSKDHDDYIQSKFNINESIRNAKSMILEQFKHKGIYFGLNLDGSLPDPVGNTFKFEQVIVNLIINAKDAIEEKERLAEVNFPKAVEISTFRDEQNICVEVKDNGIGIEPKEADKVMLPFYSTKGEGAGSGLGLAISFGIIRDMKGTIEIQSERMKGTTIRILIPIKAEAKKTGKQK